MRADGECCSADSAGGTGVVADADSHARVEVEGDSTGGDRVDSIASIWVDYSGAAGSDGGECVVAIAESGEVAEL